MSVAHVEVLVEEPSAEALLNLLLPKILGDVSFAVYPHTCKQELLLRLPQRLKGYADWLPDDWRIVVLVDRDGDACEPLKQQLDEVAAGAGLRTRRSGGAVQVVSRIAIEELEAWYFGDWEAVVAAWPRVNPRVPAQARYRDPDAIAGGTWEALERVLQSAGYFRSGLRKIEAARQIGPHLDPARNRSPSFIALRDALLQMVRP